MNKIKFIILLGAVFIFSSCGFTGMESWDSMNGKLMKKSFRSGCMRGSFVLPNFSDIETLAKSIEWELYRDDLCDCMTEGITVLFPTPNKLKEAVKEGKFKSDNPDMIELMNGCLNSVLGPH